MELLKQLDEGYGIDAPGFHLSDSERADTLERLDGEIYLSTRVRKYVLLRLDSVLAADPGASYDHKIITVEHVLPQNPSPGSQWNQDFNEEEAAQWTHRLGNLLLLNRRTNSRARNSDFDVHDDGPGEVLTDVRIEHFNGLCFFAPGNVANECVGNLWELVG